MAKSGCGLRTLCLMLTLQAPIFPRADARLSKNKFGHRRAVHHFALARGSVGHGRRLSCPPPPTRIPSPRTRLRRGGDARQQAFQGAFPFIGAKRTRRAPGAIGCRDVAYVNHLPYSSTVPTAAKSPGDLTPTTSPSAAVSTPFEAQLVEGSFVRIIHNLRHES